ncbi:MAG: ATP-binding protein [Myxococcota bacterium]
MFDADGLKLIDIRVGSGDWCSYIFQNSEGRRKCTNLVARIKQFNYPELEGGEVVEQKCFSGLKYVLMPIVYGGDMLGRVVYGPFLPAELSAPDEEVYQFPDDFDPNRLWKYGERIRRAPDEMIIKILNNFRRVIDTITFIAMKALMTRQLHLESITSSYEEIQEKNRELRTSYEQLRALDRMKSNFLAMISHELRTPLTSVIGYSEMLLEGMAGDLNDEQHGYINTIKDKGESLLELITSLLDMSKIEAGAMQLHLSAIDVPHLLEAASSYIVPQANKKKVQLQLRTSGELPEVNADVDKLRQCIVNLLSNAVKFTPEGGRIQLGAEVFRGIRRYGAEAGRFGPPEERFLRIVVRDSGIGIPEGHLNKIFNSFYQVDNTITREFGGTGLGLAIVKRFMEAHKGEVWVDSEQGRGTVFSLLIPLDGDGELAEGAVVPTEGL